MKLWKFGNKESTSQKGEDLATKLLKKAGYKILARNYRNPLGEIDIVAKEHDVIVFVEVKTRKVAKFGLAKEAVHAQKQKKLIRLAQAYLKQHRLTSSKARFDVVAIQLDNNRVEIIKDAFSVPT